MLPSKGSLDKNQYYKAISRGSIQIKCALQLQYPQFNEQYSNLVKLVQTDTAVDRLNLSCVSFTIDFGIRPTHTTQTLEKLD